MVLSDKLLSILVCPNCKSDLDYKENEERLNCNACKLSYKIENGIPIMLVDEAEKL